MNNTNHNIFDEERRNNFYELYISNVDKRLRELDQPKDVDCKRWVWELIQNAKDSIVGQTDRKYVDIEIIAEGNKYIFKHNGSPFIKKTLYGLLYKYSKGKKDNSESTGRFGTGFLTTHTLSKIVKISGDIILQDKTKGFEITMYREGEGEELLEGLNKTEDSFQLYDKPFVWTTFEYLAKTERNKEAGRLGIQNLKENITKVMLFCPEIRSVKLNDNGKILTIKQGDKIDNLNNGCEKLTLNVCDNNVNFFRTFLYINYEESNEQLNERFKQNRILKICCAIELDNDNNIFVDESSPCLFCSLPFIGSEKHKLPFIINSQNFEPDSERQSILLDGKEINEITGKISDQGINKMILSKSKQMFENLLECLCKENIRNRYYLARGLTSIPENDEIQSFDRIWYKDNFVEPMRDILIKYPIIWNGKEYIKLENLPNVKYYDESDSDTTQREAYNFIAKVYEQQVPTYEESIQLENYIWKNDDRIKYITLEECTKELSKLNNMDALGEKIDNAWEWMDDFLLFIKKHEPECLKKYEIIPNMNSNFVTLTDTLSTSKEVPDNMIECLEIIGEPWKLTHIHKNIKKYSPGIDHNIQYAVAEIRNCVNKSFENILILISYIPNDNNDQKFIQKRKTIYKLCYSVFNDTNNYFMPMEMDGTLFPRELWNGIDEVIFVKLLENIQQYGKFNKIFTDEYMKEFLECVSEYYPTFKNYKVVPNQNGVFCKVNDLYEDIQIPDLFKECMKTHFNCDIKEELIDNNLISIKSLINGRSKKVYDYIDFMNSIFNSNKVSNVNKQNASRELIRIIPCITDIENQDNSWQKYQRSVFEIYKIFSNRKEECCEIQNDYQNKDFWHYINKYIYEEIVAVIEKYRNIDELTQALNINPSQKLFDYLNTIIKISSKGRIIPNQYEEFCLLDDLYNEGITNVEDKEIELISEKLKDIAKDLGYDVRRYLIHPNMERICKSNVSEKEMNEKIAKLMEENNNNPIKRSDSNYNNVANNLIEYNFEKIRNNSLDDEIMYIFGKVYLANIRNRLRELEHPSIVDCKRWVWELIQNAKDSIVGQKDRKDIDIEIIANSNEYTFKHNGSPFTGKTLSALLYKFSESKDNNSESIGRFGTGFLTTHSLSKTVKISGNIISGNKINRFEVTMHREGEEDELLKGLNETKNSYREFDDTSEEWTIYEYEAKTEKNKEAGRLGIQNFKENITKVMLFCPEIRSVKLNDNGKILTIKQGKILKDLQGGCEKLTLDVNDDNNIFSRTFIYIKKEEKNNKELTERFKKERNLRISCAIELDTENNIFVDESSPCLFCSLPLVGSEKHKLPFIINSQDFEPDSERQFILLDGKEINEKTGKISNQGINKMILLRSQQMYENLIECLCEENIGKRYLLARGLTSIPENDEIQSFDHIWYKNNFVEPMRDILIKYPIVWNGDNYIELKNIPNIGCYDKQNIQHEAYNFIAKVYDQQVPTYEESIQFENYIWKNDSRINYITMEECTKCISNYENMIALSKKIDDVWEWLDNYLLFIKTNEPKCLKYKIIPNMDSKFVTLTDTLSTSKEVPDNMIECLESIGEPWKLTHIHKNIKKYTTGTDHNIQYAVSVIKNYFNHWTDKILTVISYIPDDHEDENFIQKRNIIYKLCKDVFGNSMPNRMDGNSFPKELWNGIDDIVFEKLIENIETQGTLGGIYTIKFMEELLKCVSIYYPPFRNHPIVPNQNGIFCLLDELYEDIEIPNLFKECTKKYFGYDIKAELIDKQLTYIKSLMNGRCKKIGDYIDIINNKFISFTVSDDDKRSLSKEMILIIPSASEVKSEGDEWQEFQRNVFDIYKIFTKSESECVEIQNNCQNKGLWYYVNIYIYKEIITIIEKYKNINELVQGLNISSSEKLFDYLNIITKISLDGKIIPNQYEDFCYLKNIFNEGIMNVETKKIELISDELKDIAKRLGYDVRKYLIHSNMERICECNVSEKEMNEKIAKLMEDSNNNPMKRSDSNFNDVANSLIEYNFLKLRNNSLNDEIMYIFGKVYIANIRNRLRELEHPSVIDCKRWVWELIQNAKDSIVGQEKNSIDIELNVEGDNYTFKHNGSPFTNKTLPALLYKFSEGKTNSTESIGRFGTGFLTTHSVSKIIKISGDIISKKELKRFSVTMFREGEEEELLEGLNKTKNSYQEEPTKTEGWTLFEYEAKTEKNREAGRLGIQNFKENITKVMLFCPEIRSVKLNDNGKILLIKQLTIKNNIQDGCSKLTLEINDDNTTFKRTFLYLKKEEKNNELSERFKKDRNLRISCAIELDSDNNIIVDDSSPCLFCSLPVVGSEKHKLPFIINSQDFELNTERQAILLDGKEINERTGKITDQGINKMILLKSQQMYDILLKCLCKENIGKRYFLARGLTVVPNDEVIQSFDSNWYKNNFVVPMRNILIKYPILWNGDKFIELKNLPTLGYFTDIKTQQEAYKFIVKVYDQQVPTYEDSNHYEKYIWKNDEKIKYITMNECSKDLSSYSNMIELGNKFGNNVWEWIDDYLLFIKKNESRCLKLYKIIPNMNSNFVKLTDILSTSREVPDNMIECLESIGEPWKLTHIHKNIKKFNPGIDHNIQYAISIIKGYFNHWTDKILIVISYIPDEHEDKKFVQKRNTLYELCKNVFGNSMPEKKNGNLFPKELWNGIDELVFEKLIKNIESQGRLGGVYSIEFIKKFLECVTEYYPSFRNHPIVPNQNGYFCLANKLYEDIQIPDIFKECLLNCFKKDIKAELINKQLTYIKLLTNGRYRKMKNYYDIIRRGFQSYENNLFNKNMNSTINNINVNKPQVSRYLIRLIPKVNVNQNNNSQNIQRKFFELFKIFTKINVSGCEIEQDNSNYELWNNANYYIFQEIRAVIEKYNNIDSLANYLGVTAEKVFEYLNIITKFYAQGRIIPNQYKVFCDLSNLYLESLTVNEKIPDELKDIAKDLGDDVRTYLIHPCININRSNKMSKLLTKNDVCIKIDNLVKTNYDDPKKHLDSKFKQIVNNLVETYYDKIGDEEFKKYFKFTSSERDTIILKVIYNKETRKNMAELGKKYGEQCIPKFLENENIVNMIMNDKLNDNSNIRLLIERFDEYEEIIDLILNNPDILSKIGNSDKKYQPKMKNDTSKPSKHSEIEKKYGEKCIPKLLENEGIVKLIVEGKLQDNSNLKSLIDQYKEYDNIIEHLLKNPEITNMIENGEITDDNYKLKNDDLIPKPSVVEEKYGENCIPKLMENEDIVNMIVDGKLNDNSHLKLLFEKYNDGDEIINKLLDNPIMIEKIKIGEISDEYFHKKSYDKPIIIKSDYNNKSISLAFNSTINEEEKEFYKDAFNEVIKYGSDFDFSITNKSIGYCGEAYIYEKLKKSKKFKSIQWMRKKDDDSDGQNFEYNGKSYIIDPKAFDYDIVVETMNDHTYNIIVKSTMHDFGNRVPIYFSKNQIKMMKKIRYPNEYILAIVYGVMNNPKCLFIKIKDNILLKNNNDNETFKFIIDLEKQYGKDRISNLLQNKNLINKIIDGKLQGDSDSIIKSNDSNTKYINNNKRRKINDC